METTGSAEKEPYFGLQMECAARRREMSMTKKEGGSKKAFLFFLGKEGGKFLGNIAKGEGVCGGFVLSVKYFFLLKTGFGSFAKTKNLEKKKKRI